MTIEDEMRVVGSGSGAIVFKLVTFHVSCMVGTSFSGFVYKARTQFKVNFDHQFLPTNYELCVIKIIPFKTFLKYRSNDIIFMIYYILFCGCMHLFGSDEKRSTSRWIRLESSPYI
jgi:hypothetical protein